MHPRGRMASSEEARAPACAALLRAAALPNEARLAREGDGWKGVGDTVDVALLGRRAQGRRRARRGAGSAIRWLSRIPYEPDLKYAASFHRREETSLRLRQGRAGNPHRHVPTGWTSGGRTLRPSNAMRCWRQKERLAAQGSACPRFRRRRDRHGAGRTATAIAIWQTSRSSVLSACRIRMRPEVPRAIRDCRGAGIEVAMVTGDDPGTAAVIAREAGHRLFGRSGRDRRARCAARKRRARMRSTGLTKRARIYARVEPAPEAFDRRCRWRGTAISWPSPATASTTRRRSSMRMSGWPWDKQGHRRRQGKRRHHHHRRQLRLDRATAFRKGASRTRTFARSSSCSVSTGAAEVAAVPAGDPDSACRCRCCRCSCCGSTSSPTASRM